MTAINRVKLICVGKVKEGYLKEGVVDFSKRISNYTKLDVIEVKDLGMDEEGKKILDRLGPDEYTIALCVEGRQYSSMELAKLVMDTSKPITFIIGGADGLSHKVLGKAHLRLSLSPMTFTHEMCRLFLLEQIYRAYTIIKGRPYHK